MKILVIGSRGAGAAAGAVAERRDFFERLVFADVSEPGRGPALTPAPFLELLGEYGVPQGVEDR